VGLGTSPLDRACFDDETSRRLEAFRMGGPHARRAWRAETGDPAGGGDSDDGDVDSGFGLLRGRWLKGGGSGNGGRNSGRNSGRNGGRNGGGNPKSLLRRGFERVRQAVVTAAVVALAGYLLLYVFSL